VRVARFAKLALGERIEVQGPALLALDGEREILIGAGRCAELRVERAGPPVVDIPRCLAAAREAGFLRRS
jgi:hypothetical protein